MARKRENYNDYMREYMNNRYYRRRALYIDFLGGRCCKCGSTEDLEFDHRDPNEKSFEYGKALGSMAEDKLRAEMLKAQLLCAQCHRKKSIHDLGNQEWRHGTLSGYRYCRCDKCKLAKAQFMYEYNLNLQIESGEVSVSYSP